MNKRQNKAIQLLKRFPQGFLRQKRNSTKWIIELDWPQTIHVKLMVKDVVELMDKQILTKNSFGGRMLVQR